MSEDVPAAAPAAVEAPAADPISDAAVVTPRRQRAGFIARMRRMFAGGGSEDFEKMLRHLSKEETTVLSRMKRRAVSSRKTARSVIVLSVAVETVAVAYAIMTTRSVDLSWQMRAVRVLPMFLVPALSSIIYTAIVSFTRMLERKDQKTLERLRAERQAKIDELKERTNYYSTQQLIQRYDLDPAAKAAAATILASKLGADSGLKLQVGDGSNINESSGSSNDFELAQPNGLRKRKPSHSRSHSAGSTTMTQIVNEPSNEFSRDDQEEGAKNQRVFEHYKGPSPNEGGWIARIAAMLVGEDPTQCYALICGNCHMHNGLARKEDFSYITYYCPHCHALNGSQQSEHESGFSSGKTTATTPVGHNTFSHELGNAISLETVRELSPEGNDEKDTGVHAD